jgi:hypothetical protein
MQNLTQDNQSPMKDLNQRSHTVFIFMIQDGGSSPEALAPIYYTTTLSYFFIYSLFSDAVSSSNYAASNGRMISD